MKRLNEDKKGRQQGSVAIKVMISIPLILVLVFAFYEGRKTYWDYQVKEMCAKDGGVDIKHVLKVDSETYELLKNKFGQIDIPQKGDARSSKSVAVYTYHDTYIRSHNPEVRKSQIIVFATTNNEVIATSTTYSRVGGDLLALHPSYFSCPQIPNNIFESIVELIKE